MVSCEEMWGFGGSTEYYNNSRDCVFELYELYFSPISNVINIILLDIMKSQTSYQQEKYKGHTLFNLPIC